MPSPFADTALPLWERGYSVLPLEPKSKAIKLAGWQRYCESRVNRDTLDVWLSWPDRNIGLALGSASGVVALDFDYDVDGKHAQIRRIVPPSTVEKRGAKGITSFYRYGNQRNVKYAIAGQSVLEVLSTGRQTVLPPSVHPETNQPYFWTTEKTLLSTSPEELPEITPVMMVEIEALFKGSQQAFVAHPVRQFAQMDACEISEALHKIPADDYHLWVKIGMALKDELGEKGYALWDSWSATSTKYAGGKETAIKWRSFNGSGVHIETLFWNALEMGYKPKPLPKDVPAFEPLSGGTFDAMPIEKPAPVAPPMGVDYIPGLPGKIARHILDSSVYPLPPLALAAGIALSGLIMANKVKSESGLRTNFYCLGVAESAGGKDHARRVCRAILEQANMINREIGIPKSGAGLLSGLRKSGNAGIMLLDEFGKYMQAISGKKASSHEAEITRIMMELYTSANSTFSGMEYADHDGKMPRQIIVNPCLCMYPVTTPGRFHEALTSSDALDGFVARFMVFEVEKYPLDPIKPAVATEAIPQDLLDEIQAWRMFGVSGSMGDAGDAEAITITSTPAAEALLDDFQKRMRYQWDLDRRKMTGLHPIYGRLAEIARKLALVAHEDGEISEYVALWAINVATECGEHLIKIVRDNVADNDQQKNVKQVLRVIEKICAESQTGYARLSEITRKTQNIKAQDRKSILHDLVTSGMIDEFEGEAPEGKIKPRLYKKIN